MPLPPPLQLEKLSVAVAIPNGILLEEFKLEKQDESSWCWAAVAFSIHEFYNGKKFSQQCALAAAALMTRLGNVVCCPQGINPSCDVKHSTASGLAVAGNLNGDPVGRPLEFSEIQAQIDSPVDGRPICCVWQDVADAGAHVVVISGWQISETGDLTVYVNDPDLASEDYKDYETFRNSGEREWKDTYLTKPSLKEKVLGLWRSLLKRTLGLKFHRMASRS